MDKFGFENIEYKTIAQRIVDQICKAITEGRYQPGDQIPTEPELAKSLNVGRNSVREAIKILVAFGILEIRRAEGTFVCKGVSRNMVNPLIYGIILSSGNSHAEMIEFQIAIDKSMCRMCIQKYTEEDRRELTEAYDHLMEALAREQPDLEEVYAKDRHFHDVIAKATHNEFMKIMHQSIWQLLDKTIKLEVFTELQQGADKMAAYHKEIYEAIIDHDENAAAAAIRQAYYIEDKNNTK